MTTIVNETILLQKYLTWVEYTTHSNGREASAPLPTPQSPTTIKHNKEKTRCMKHIKVMLRDTRELAIVYQWFQKHCTNPNTGTSCTHKYGWSIKKKLLSIASLNVICIVAESDINTAVSATQPDNINSTSMVTIKQMSSPFLWLV